MKTKLLGTVLFMLTLGAVAFYPKLEAGSGSVQALTQAAQPRKPAVDVVFVLDTTGSMSGLIQTAKDKIWSIATTMASAQPTPEIRIGLVAYRDRGDAYVTRVTDLTSDLDSIHATLMGFRADGGGDAPESVNQALYDAVHRMSWSKADQAYKVVFLVGDAPPHMDYNEMRYPEIVASALEQGIVVNTVQCGTMPATIDPWTQIARLGGGSFFQVEQAGGAVAFTTPFDEEIARLSAKLDATRLYFGTGEAKERAEQKLAATKRLHAEASVESLARRGVFNAGAGGRANLAGESELVDAVASGSVDLDTLEEEALPEALKPMAPAEQRAYVERLASERNDLKERIVELARERDAFIEAKVEEAGGMDDSLDRQLFDAVRKQAGEVGFEYGDGPAY